MSEITDAFDSEFSKTMLRGPRFKELEGGVEQEYLSLIHILSCA